MPPLRLVPDLPGEPDAVALEAVAPEIVSPGDPASAAPVQWFPCDEPAVGAQVRAHVLTALNLSAVETDTIADAMVLVSELVTNVRDHTVSHALGVRVRVTGGRIVVAVIEKDPSDAPADGRLHPGPADTIGSDRPLPDRGRGLRILDSMASEWGFVRRGGVTTTWFALPAAPPVTPAREPEIRRF